MAKSIVDFMSDADNIKMIDELIKLGVKITNKYQGVVDLKLNLNKTFLIY